MSIRTINKELVALYEHQLRVESQCTTLIKVRSHLSVDNPAWDINTEKIMKAKEKSQQLGDQIICLRIEHGEVTARNRRRMRLFARVGLAAGLAVVVIIAML